ncbi:MAG: hypothetical protein EOP45_01040 [Sphingobacteriaceae bacterium]|nr:MAG: hypothetical protein EOP45_01040 [Sphingobacteriaceae bacterium]
MIKSTEIEQSIVNCYASELPDNMIGAAILINSDQSQHAAIFIRYKGDSQIFHFDGATVIIEDVSGFENYHFKALNFIEPILLPAFFTQCELILEKAQPQFGYFYEGALYNSNGDFISPSSSPEYMTCVGFCLNVIKGFLSDEDFFQYDDWDEKTLTGKMEYVEDFLKKVKESHPAIKLDDFRVNLRRILPVEYVAGAFSKSLPVTKSFTDSIVMEVQKVLDKVA